MRVRATVIRRSSCMQGGKSMEFVHPSTHPSIDYRTEEQKNGRQKGRGKGKKGKGKTEDGPTAFSRRPFHFPFSKKMEKHFFFSFPSLPLLPLPSSFPLRDSPWIIPSPLLGGGSDHSFGGGMVRGASFTPSLSLPLCLLQSSLPPGDRGTADPPVIRTGTK